MNQEEEENKLWFQIVQESEIDQIEMALIKRPDWIYFRQRPLMHTAIFVICKEREDNQGAAIIQMMIGKGANINTINQLGQNVLFYAAAHNKQQICRMLLLNGVNHDCKDQFGQTAREYASALGHNSLTLAIDQHLQKIKSPIIFSQSGQATQNNLNKILQVPKLTYHLCKLTIAGRVVNLTLEQIIQLQKANPALMELMRNSQKIFAQPFLPQQNWRVLGLKIVDKLWQLSDSFWFRHNSQIWKLQHLKPDIPGLDLQIIRMKLTHHMYLHPKELRTDVKNIWANCKQRLGIDHEMTRSALSLCNHFQHLADYYAYNAYLRP